MLLLDICVAPAPDHSTFHRVGLYGWTSDIRFQFAVEDGWESSYSHRFIASLLDLPFTSGKSKPIVQDFSFTCWVLGLMFTKKMDLMSGWRRYYVWPTLMLGWQGVDIRLEKPDFSFTGHVSMKKIYASVLNSFVKHFSLWKSFLRRWIPVHLVPAGAAIQVVLTFYKFIRCKMRCDS